MSDTSAQPTTGLVRRFVGDPNSTIGSMIKQGMTGSMPAPSPSVSQAPPAESALDVLEKVLDRVEQTPPPVQESTAPANQVAADDVVGEGMTAQVMRQVVDQAAESQQAGAAPMVGTTQKEAAEAVSLEQVAQDAARGAQVIETEPAPEIPPEVESYLQRVEDRKDTAPPEIVIADGNQQPPASQYPTEPVVVLPITEEMEKQGAKKGVHFSLRWLVEWSRRLMKIFTGKIIYRPIEETTA